MKSSMKAEPARLGLRGAGIGGVIGITVWQILAGSLLGLGFFLGLAVLVVYMAACSLLGLAIERQMYRKLPIDKRVD